MNQDAAGQIRRGDPTVSDAPGPHAPHPPLPPIRPRVPVPPPREPPTPEPNAFMLAIAHRRLFVLAPTIFIIGLISYRLAPAEPHLGVLLAVGAALGVMTIVARPHFWPWRIWSLLAVGWAGVCCLPVHGALFGTPMLAYPAYGTYTARLVAQISDDGSSQRWRIGEIEAHEPRSAVPIRHARIVAPSGLDIEPGDRFTARLRLYPVPGPVVSGGHDAQFTGYFSGIGAYGSVLGDIEVIPATQSDPERLINSLRSAIAARILTALDERVAGIAIALIIGDQSRVHEEDRETMALSGLAHVLSISGLHLSLVAGTVFGSLRFGLAALPGIAQRWPVKKIAAVGGIVVAIAYLLISGMGVPAIRSTIMLCLVFGAVLAGRRALTMRNVAIAALAVLLVEPVSAFRASFQLSFAAVVALIAAYEFTRGRPRKPPSRFSRVTDLMVGIGVTSLVAGAATAFFTAYHFQQTAPFGVVGNLLAIPIVSFVMMPAGLLAMLVMPLGMEEPFLLVMGWSIEMMIGVGHFTNTLSGGFDPSPILHPSSLVISLLGLAWLAFFTTRIRLVGPALMIPAIAVFSLDPRPDILVADGTQALAVRHEGVMTLMAGRNNTFATRVWSERFIEPIVNRHADTRCDGQGCVLTSSHGFTVALVLDRPAFYEDCAVADLVIARMPAPPFCHGLTQVVDADALARQGVHGLYWHPEMGRFTTRPAIEDVNRPWRRSVRD